MSTGQIARTPAEFPRMKYRAFKRDMRMINRLRTSRRIGFYDTGSVEMLTPAETLTRLTELRERKQYRCLADSLPDVGAATINPYWEIVRLMPASSRPWGNPWTVDWCRVEMIGPYRTSLVTTYAWSIPSPSDIAWMRDILDGRAVIEIGAGNGYWAWQLRQAGVDVLPFDNGEQKWDQQWSPVYVGGTSVARRHPERALMLIWPTFSSPMARAALDSYGGDLLLYAGEGHGGCTGDDTFHDELERAWVQIGEAPGHPAYDGIHCSLVAYRREAPGTGDIPPIRPAP